MNIASYEHLTIARSQVNNAIAQARTQLAQIERQHNRNMNSLLKCTQRFYETGVAFATVEAQAALATAGIKPKEYFVQLAKQLKRPMLNSYATRRYLYGVGYVDTIILKLPRSMPMQNLAGGLLLVSTEIEPSVRYLSKPVTHSANSRNWEFYFNGKEGRTHFLRFIKTCRENPVARIALKLPVLPTE